MATVDGLSWVVVGWIVVGDRDRKVHVVKIGAVYPQTELRGDPDAVRQIGRFVEAADYDYLLAYDHVVGAVHDDREPALLGPYTERDPFHDPFVMFAHLAAITERIDFATGVLILPQRQTVLVAKQAADLDLLSGGRFRLGVGVGWNYVEYDALGEDFTRRGKRADEQIGVLRQLWSGQVESYQGTFDRLDRGVIVPGPGRQIPIWVGGFSDAAFERGVRLGDGFIFAGNEERVHAACDRLESLAVQHGRDLHGFGREALIVRGVDDPDAQPGKIAEAAHRWRERGGTHFGVVSMGAGRDSTESHIDLFGAVAEQLVY